MNIKGVGNGLGNRGSGSSAQHVLHAALWQAKFAFKGSDTAISLSQIGFDIFWMRTKRHG
jgi:hypothetical protein